MPPEWNSIVSENYKIKKTEYSADLFMIFLMMSRFQFKMRYIGEVFNT